MSQADTESKGNYIREKYEVVVVGGGLAGICAAISAARLGCKTVLIHDRPVLGGNSSSEVKVTVDGANIAGKKRDLRESGIIEELRLENWHRNDARSFYIWDAILFEWVTREQNLVLHLNTSAREVVLTDQVRIKSIICSQLSTEKDFFIDGDIFIDASGDGAMAYQAGAKFRMGREGKSEYGEDLAPEKPDAIVLGSSLLFQAKDMRRPVRFVPPVWAKKFESEENFVLRDHGNPRRGYWWIEWGGKADTIKSNEEIRDELLKALMGVWDHIKNHGNHGADNLALDWIGSVPGKRESRRFMGDYVLTQKDVVEDKAFSDGIAYGGWGIDIHAPDGIYSKTGPFYAHKTLKGPYTIPFRCLYSENIENLMFAGRNISVSHVALGSTRIMSTCAVLGQAAGTAAFYCRKYKITPRDVGRDHIMELQQQLLKDDCYIPNLTDQDDHDLARNAIVTHSSERCAQVISADTFRDLDVPRAELVPISTNRIDEVALLLKSSLNKPVDIKLHARKARNAWDFSSEEDVVCVSASVSPGKSWISFPLHFIASPGLYWFWLPECTGLSWGFSRKELPGLQSAKLVEKLNGLEIENCWDNAERGDYCFRLLPESFPFGGKNVISGVS
ncbi:MAG: FAD-dependent oxidoreductase, partial [Verrucomicrobia bacterium]|nr:FAD-dependent oxidoreductase [Verrucomicrobiota bacterium]